MEENMYVVYQHSIEINGILKRYIGITSYENPERRWENGRGYRPHGKTKSGKVKETNSSRFYNAILKYGWENFEHEILYRNLSKSEAEAKEQELIFLYLSYLPEFGYNMDMGGSSQGKHSDATKKKISLNHADFKGAKHPECKGSVIQLDLEGNELEVFESVRDASEQTGISAAVIRQNVAGKHSSGGGFQWFYVDDYLDKKEAGASFVYFDSRTKKVAKIDDDGKVLEVFPNMKSAGMSVGIPEKQASARILISIQNNHKCSGYYWIKIKDN